MQGNGTGKFLVIMHIKDFSAGKFKTIMVLAKHGKRLKKQQDAGTLLFGGPAIDRTVAALVYKANSKDEVEAIVRKDPLATHDFVDYEIHPFADLHDLLGSKELLMNLVGSMG